MPFFKKLFIFSVFSLFILFNSFSQTPFLKQWDYRYGGNSAEFLTNIFQDSNRNIILFGGSASDTSGDKSQPNWDPNLLSFDFWIVKTDSLGNKIWDRRLGGNSDENLNSILFSPDNYVLGGTSSSGISGDKTQSSRGQSDFWVVKTDTAGNKLWDKRYGGNKLEGITSIVKTNDNGYLAGGYSNSGINGDKTQSNWDASLSTTDYWIVKSDSNGNKLWDKRFGGTGTDQLNEIVKDGTGFLLCGYSLSGIGGDITQANWDPFNNSADYWIVKIDANGNKLWQKRYGGDYQDILYHAIKVSDGFILAGTSSSNTGGDKSAAVHDTVPFPQGCDYWFVKIDPIGNKIWDKVIGGNLCENGIGTFQLTNDGNILIAGISYSPASWEKSENNLGIEQTWALKTDTALNKIWDKTVFTLGHDEQGLLVEWGNGCYLFANYTAAEIGGDKSQANWDTTNTYGDYWMVKFCDTTTGINSAVWTEYDKLRLYPDPAKDELIVSCRLLNVNKATIEIYNLFGQSEVKKKLETKSAIIENKVDVRKLKNGIYLLIFSDGKREWTKRFIINR